jgi:plastocyanin
LEIILLNGQPLPQINAAAAFPNIENGGTYTGGEVNSGLPQGVLMTTFSLVIDAEPGRYMYFCDVHPGMVGVIEVVADDVEIPSPGEVDALALDEINQHLVAGIAAQPALLGDIQGESVEGVLHVTAGSENLGRTIINAFAPAIGVIQAGETVTWTTPAGSIEPHFVNISPYDAAALPEFVPQQIAEDAPPVLALGPGFLGTTADGSVVNLGDSFNSSFIVPGQSFSLTFADPGVYAYECHIHPNMKGVIVVEDVV